jgi:hypothetical protein
MVDVWLGEDPVGNWRTDMASRPVEARPISRHLVRGSDHGSDQPYKSAASNQCQVDGVVQKHEVEGSQIL